MPGSLPPSARIRRPVAAVARDRTSAMADPVMRRLFAALMALTLAACLALAAGQANARPAPESFADLVEKLTPAVVNISTTQSVEVQGPQIPMPQFPPGSPFEDLFRDFFGDRGGQPGATRKVQALGSGFIISAEGLVVTNNHVIKDADEISVILTDNTTLPAEVVGTDPKTDLAVLRVKSTKPLPFVSWGDSATSRVGDWVIAVGNPFGLGGSVTAGIISARARDINVGPFDDFLQTDAAINRGNSGGPMFNMAGEVIGINTAIFSPTGGSVGIGFAVPSMLARPVIEQLVEYGRTRRGWLGVQIQPVTDDIAESLGLDRAHGALVARVMPDSPAATAGIEVGDVVVRFDGKDVAEMRELPRIVAETEINRSVPVEIWRNNRKVDLKVTVGELDEADIAEAAPDAGNAQPEQQVGTSLPAVGLTVAQADGAIRDRYGLGPDVTGVVITEIDANGPANDKPIRVGDVIVDVGQRKVERVADIETAIKEARDAGRKSVLMLVRTGDDSRFVALRLKD
nr:DegQ family serine endoprotease [Tistrella bauzanensis]